MLQRVVWNLKLNVFSPNDGQFRVYCIALSNVNQPAPILVLRDEGSVLSGKTFFELNVTFRKFSHKLPGSGHF